MLLPDGTYPFPLLGLLSPADPTRASTSTPSLPTFPLLPKASSVEALDVVGKRKLQPRSWEDGKEMDETHSSLPPPIRIRT